MDKLHKILHNSGHHYDFSEDEAQMTLRHRVLPSVPGGVALTALAPNLKLYSEFDIRTIKSQFTKNGRYRHYLDADGIEQRLKYPVFVFNGRYYASYPAKLLLLGQSLRDKIKVVQDLESGEWLAEKVILSTTHSTLAHEANILQEMKQAEVVKGEAMMLFREPAASAKKSPPSMPVFFGGNIDADESEFITQAPVETSGKGYLFMRRAESLPISNFAAYAENMPAILKIYITMALVNTVSAMHERNWLHRNIQPENFSVNTFKAVQEAVTMVGFGYAVKLETPHDSLLAPAGVSIYHAPEVQGDKDKLGQYSKKSDIYALGVMLKHLWNDFDGQALKPEMNVIIESMLNANPANRIDLQTTSKLLQKLHECLNTAERTINIGVLDVDEVFAARKKGEEYFQLFIKNLRQYTSINLFSADDELSDIDLLAIRAMLEAKHFIVSSSVSVATHAVMFDEISRFNSNRSSGHTIYQMSFITSARRVTERARQRGDVYLDFGIDDSDNSRERLLPDADGAEQYNMCECLTWFFSSLMQDICRPLQNRGTRFDIFSRPPSPIEEPLAEPSPDWERLRKMV